MSSGTLPLATYHRAAALGEGTYGSVVVVYNDDGEEFALKLFLDDDDSDGDEEEEDEYEEESEAEESDDDDEDEDAGSDDEDEEEGEMHENQLLDIGAIREISILRLLRHDNAHPNIVEIADVKPIECGEEENVGAGTDGVLGLAMPVYHDGTVATAIDNGSLASKKDKVAIAHGLLSAVAYLHRNGIIHRDIKSDNVCLMRKDDGTISPILIDFSLAKLCNAAMYEETNEPTLRFGDISGEQDTTHTSDCGTPTYRAPEVINGDPYGLVSDCWSVGVILLETLTGHTLTVEKDGQAIRLVEELTSKLPDQPFANLVRGLLTVDPTKRLSAYDALQSKLFQKFGLEIAQETRKIVSLGEAFDEEENGSDEIRGLRDATNKGDSGAGAGGGKTPGKKTKVDPKVARRMKAIDKVCHELDTRHPLVRHAALTYATHMLELDETIFDGPGKAESQALLDCVVLAAKTFECDVPDLNELDEKEIGMFKEWSMDDYVDTETTVWMLMDFCLLPRRLVNWV